MYRHENALRARERIGFYAVFYGTPEMEQTVDRGPRPRHSAPDEARRATPDQSHNFGDKVIRVRGGDTQGSGSADRVDTSRDNGDYREESIAYFHHPSLPFPLRPTDSAGEEVPSVCLISGIQSLGSMPGQPTASLSTNRSFVQFYPLPSRPSSASTVDPFPFGSGRGGCLHAATPPPNSTLELLPNPLLSFSPRV